MNAEDGEPGHNYLCAGLKLFFTHSQPAIAEMSRLFRAGHPVPEVMAWAQAADKRRGPDAPCPCGSRQRFNGCHGAARTTP